MKKRLIAILTALTMLIPAFAFSEDPLLVPSAAAGAGLPSLGTIVHRYPDAESVEADGSTVQLWQNVTQEEMDAFSAWLQQNDAELQASVMEDGGCETAIAFDEMVFHCRYDAAKQTATVRYPSGTCDVRSRNAAAHYHAAKEYLSAGECVQAAEEFMLITDYAAYKDVQQLLENDPQLSAGAAAAREARLTRFKTAGSYVTFGTWPQVSPFEKTPIEWLVLDVQDHRALLLSRCGLCINVYNSEFADITWEKSTLRAWLNDTFLNDAFTAQEQSGILLTDVDNSSIQGWSEWSTDGGNNTRDRVFLLSCTEASQYFEVTDSSIVNLKSRVAPAARYKEIVYTDSSFLTEDGMAAGDWWLRSPGRNQNEAAVVSISGAFIHVDVDVHNILVRPALWIDLDADLF